MFEISTDVVKVPMIDFGTTKKGKKNVLFQLPVLGQPGVPMGITSAFGMFYDKFKSGRALTDGEVASSWSYFIQTLADTYPDATRQIARLDEDQLRGVVEFWVKESNDYDPKASPSLESSTGTGQPSDSIGAPASA